MKAFYLALATSLAFASSAMAQDASVSLPSNLVEFLVQIIFLVVSGVIATFLPIILARLAKKFKLEIEQEKRDSLQTTLTNAAAGLIKRLGDEAVNLKVDVKDPNLAEAVKRVLRGAPDAVKWAGLTEQEIAKRVLEKVVLIHSSTKTN